MSEPAARPMKKSAARLGAVQALYQMDLAQTPVNDILAEFESHWLGQEVEGIELPDADLKLFRAIVEGVLAAQREIDPTLDAVLSDGWPLKRVEAVLRAVLRAGAYEMMFRDAPAKVVITEYVNVAAAFLDRDETGMVNAVLDALARRVRTAEFEVPGLARPAPKPGKG